ncbi:MAG: hypothetical protein M0Z41_19670 [Peptococcaceae bacterium]|nr:hypothetical protein [Peptococcaceae bacterium]
MKIFTDCPERFPVHMVVREPGLAQAAVLFAPGSARLVAGLDKPVYLVAERMPLSLAGSGAGIRLIRSAELARLGEAPEERTGEPEMVGNVIVSYSPGTNVGKTFIAANMAAWLALRGRPTVLLDLDIEASGTWEILGWKASRGVAASVAGWNGDPENLGQAVQKGEHPTIGRMYMIKRGSAGAAQVVSAVRALAALGFTVVIDTSNNQELPYVNSVLGMAEKVFLVATLTLKVQARLAEMYANVRSAAGLTGRLALCVNRVGYHEEEGKLRPEDLARQFMMGRHYVVHENGKGRRQAIQKRTFAVALKSAVGRELAGMFEKEFPGAGEEKAGRERAGLFPLRKVVVS